MVNRVDVVHGVIAGAAGTTALELATHLDMAVRGRPASTTPQQTVERLTRLLRVPLPRDPLVRDARLTGAGALLGAAAGVGVGAVLGVVHGTLRQGGAATVGTAWILAMLVGNGPMTVLGVTSPRAWTREDWLADVVPHLAYALAAGGTLAALDR